MFFSYITKQSFAFSWLLWTWKRILRMTLSALKATCEDVTVEHSFFKAIFLVCLVIKAVFFSLNSSEGINLQLNTYFGLFWSRIFSRRLSFSITELVSLLSQVGCGVCGGEILHPNPCYFLHRWGRVEEMAGEDLSAGFPKVLWEEGVENGVDAGVSVGHAVRQYAEREGGIVQREVSKFHPHGNDMVGHPAEEECCHNQ